jgi:hypothetical protein
VRQPRSACAAARVLNCRRGAAALVGRQNGRGGCLAIVVIGWTAFPRAFASAGATLINPLTLAAVGIVFRGSVALASGRIPYGGFGDVLDSWTNPTSLFAASRRRAAPPPSVWSGGA